MPENQWFVASVRSCQERRIALKLSELGIETYVPVQKVKRKWSDRVKVVDKLLIPGLVFIHCDEKTRLSLFDRLYGLAFFLVDRSNEIHRPLVVPDGQMEDFMKVARAYADGPQLTVAQRDISKGDTVKILRGPLQGFVCECVQIQNRHKIIIRLGPLGSLLAEISASDVLKV